MTLDTPPLAVVEPTWLAVCTLDDLVPERGVPALVDGEQVALFRLGDDTVHAVQQLDPFSGAYVMARGLVGTRGDVPTVASPMYKQVFDLRTGECLEAVGATPQHLRTWPVRVDGRTVHVGHPA
ncbi:nitrite reductase small subunit NirD [Sanguibacter suaedae]|uniref:Nitrite reductase small subunit NirD n=1 Tax=Sanguibacter suaedae TaxID=2795737 RepID=A0A934I9U6_9MICO|nr:nitrite reductase small subunit NirD [Sanguibacter suaedae]MBI9115727.1 nitrite reductase small subunit NirD [Sanguibacter suaedae]